MDDRELLELAAKAAGHPQGRHVALGGLLMANDLYWNPLTDDGDALRLAVKLRLHLIHEIALDRVVCETDLDRWLQVCGDDPYAATRRAIVRAAAEIGAK